MKGRVSTRTRIGRHPFYGGATHIDITHADVARLGRGTNLRLRMQLGWQEQRIHVLKVTLSIFH